MSFVYQGVNYDSCTSVDVAAGRFWCATSVNSDLTYRTWAYCPTDRCTNAGMNNEFKKSQRYP